MKLYTHLDIQYQIADKIKDIRKEKKITQKQMALDSDIPLSTYARIEQLGEGSLKDFAKILITLDRADEINKILQKTEVTPMDVYERMKKL
ncbi:MAG: helix-turn-helix transcriptional regulator [Campylobacterota bacterium]|nr:helix-turn-helix transcriptional regulator [Campylobacterota bacterium]